MNIEICTTYYPGTDKLWSEYQHLAGRTSVQHGWYKSYDKLGNLFYLNFIYYDVAVGVVIDTIKMYHYHPYNFYLI